MFVGVLVMLSFATCGAFAPAGRVAGMTRNLAMMAKKKKEMPANPVAVGNPSPMCLTSGSFFNLLFRFFL